MIKTHYRDYAISAFSFYHQEGSAEQFKMRIFNEAILEHVRAEERGNSISKPSESAIVRAETAVLSMSAAIADLEAVERTLSVLKTFPSGESVLRALGIVYMSGADAKISSLVHRAEFDIPASERQIYYWLKLARYIFAIERNLRV